MLTTKVFFIWLHIGAIVAWIGGLLTMPFVFWPVLRAGVDSPGLAARVAAAAAQRFQRISRELIVLILLTGIFNLIYAGVGRSFQFGAAYLAMLGAKVLLFVVLIGLQVWQSARLYPALATLTAGVERRSDPAPGAVKPLQRRVLFASVLCALLGMVAVLLGLQLRFH